MIYRSSPVSGAPERAVGCNGLSPLRISECTAFAVNRGGTADFIRPLLSSDNKGFFISLIVGVGDPDDQNVYIMKGLI